MHMQHTPGPLNLGGNGVLLSQGERRLWCSHTHGPTEEELCPVARKEISRQRRRFGGLGNCGPKTEGRAIPCHLCEAEMGHLWPSRCCPNSHDSPTIDHAAWGWSPAASERATCPPCHHPCYESCWAGIELCQFCSQLPLQECDLAAPQRIRMRIKLRRWVGAGRMNFTVWSGLMSQIPFLVEAVCSVAGGPARGPGG